MNGSFWKQWNYEIDMKVNPFFHNIPQCDPLPVKSVSCCFTWVSRMASSKSCGKWTVLVVTAGAFSTCMNSRVASECCEVHNGIKGSNMVKPCQTPLCISCLDVLYCFVVSTDILAYSHGFVTNSHSPSALRHSPQLEEWNLRECPLLQHPTGSCESSNQHSVHSRTAVVKMTEDIQRRSKYLVHIHERTNAWVKQMFVMNWQELEQTNKAWAG